MKAQLMVLSVHRMSKTHLATHQCQSTLLNSTQLYLKTVAESLKEYMQRE